MRVNQVSDSHTCMSKPIIHHVAILFTTQNPPEARLQNIYDNDIHSFINAISIAPLQVHYFLEALPTQHGHCAGV